MTYAYTDDITDKILVVKYLEGDSKAFKPLFYKYKALFFHNAKEWYSSAYTNDELQDMALEFLGRICSKLDLYNPEKAQFNTWMTQSMKNFMIEVHRRKSKRPKNKVSFDEIPDIGIEETIHKGIQNQAYRKLIREMIESLGKEDTRMFNEVLLKGRSQTEVANEMGIKVSTFNYRFHRMQQRLQKFKPKYL
jgi:RNA polymerase sigma factor (sigma-70 family)